MNAYTTRAGGFAAITSAAAKRISEEIDLVEHAAKIARTAALKWRTYCAVLELLLGGES